MLEKEWSKERGWGSSNRLTFNGYMEFRVKKKIKHSAGPPGAFQTRKKKLTQACWQGGQIEIGKAETGSQQAPTCVTRTKADQSQRADVWALSGIFSYLLI